MNDDNVIRDVESMTEERQSFNPFKMCAACQLSFDRRHLNEDGLCRDCEVALDV